MPVTGNTAENFFDGAFSTYGLSSATIRTAQARAEKTRRATRERIQGRNRDFLRSVDRLRQRQTAPKASPAFVGKEQPTQTRTSAAGGETIPSTQNNMPQENGLGFNDPATSGTGKKSASENPFQTSDSDLFPGGVEQQSAGSAAQQEEGKLSSGDQQLAQYDEQLAQLAKQKEKKVEETREDAGSVAVAVAKNRLKLLKELTTKRIKKWISDAIAAAADGAVIGLFFHAYSRYLGWRMRNIPDEIQKNTIKTKESVRKAKDQTKTTVADITKEERRVRRERRQYLEQLREGE